MYEVLGRINYPSDIKKLNNDGRIKLAEEVRGFLTENVSKTGGHLASNLGVVELTIALHSVFSTPKDKIVWDVGHQSYVHKMFTGRRDRFDTLRTSGGISGFPKREESEHDCFNTGHSSTSVSAALGLAKAKMLKGEEGSCVAVIGDGALTGGMAFEALNHAGSSKTPFIVVLNDNGMSISQNVGGVARYLNRIRNNPLYFNLKDDVKGVLDRIPLIGKGLKKIIHRFKIMLKDMLIQGKMFEDMGLTYLGPVDGHYIEGLIDVLKRARELREPVIVHVHTQKGRGYPFAEESPDLFHGVGKFDLDTGLSSNECGKTYTDIFEHSICSIAAKNDRVIAITAAMPIGTGLKRFSEEFPNRFFDVGIAEQHAVTFAAAMAAEGIVPVVAVYSTFLQRAYDQIMHDAALQNLHVVFAVDRAGCVGNDGETHQGLYDLSYLLHIPNMTVLAPANGAELSAMLDFAVNRCNSPVAVRYPRGAAVDCDISVDIKHGGGQLVYEGSDVLIISVGTMLSEAMQARELLGKQGISCSLINARFAKPLDEKLITDCAKKCKIVATIEDNTVAGGFGSYAEAILGREVIKFGYPDKPIEHGSIQELKKRYGLDGAGIADRILQRLR